MLGNVRGHHAHDRHVARSTEAINGWPHREANSVTLG